MKTSLLSILLPLNLILFTAAICFGDENLPSTSVHGAGEQLQLPAGWRFEEPLIAMKPTSSQEDQAIRRATEAYRAQPDVDDFQAFEKFLKDYPDSGWIVGLLTNMGLIAYQSGRFLGAIDCWEEAWQDGRFVTEPRAKALVDRALGELVRMHSRLGHTDRMKALLDQIGSRPLNGSAGESVTATREALWLMQHEPGTAFLCGPFALRNLLISERAAPEKIRRVQDYRSSPHGVTLQQVGDLADAADYPHRLIYRAPDQPIPVPSVVHWKVQHFAAIIGEKAGRYHVQDPTFGTDLWITRAAIDSESSGYFLVPAGTLNTAWRSVGSQEASEIRGMGVTNTSDPLATLINDILCKSCSNTPGMATYDEHEMLVSLHISDTPMGYVVPKGPSAAVTIDYNQREATQPGTFTSSNVSKLWEMNWLAYISDYPAYPGAYVMRYAAGGGAVQYSGFDSSTGAFTPETRDASLLVETSADPIAYERRLKDGSREVYGHSDGATGTFRRIFLTQVVDAAGNTVSLAYDSYQDQPRLVSLTDASGGVTTFSYGLKSQPLLITQVTDPYGRSAHIDYDASGRLNKITDVLGMISSFSYDDMSYVNAMTTPYGTTHFAYGSTDGNERYLQATDPLGYTEKLEYRQGAPGIPYADPPQLVPSGMIGPWNNYIYGRDTFYWDKHAFNVAGTDYTMARNRHWAHESDNIYATSHVVEAYKYPLENRVSMNYSGQTISNYSSAIEGSFDLPIFVGRVLDDNSTQLLQNTYNLQGNLTSTIDPAGRETVFTYAANGIDLVQVQQKTSSTGYSTIARYSSNDQHLPLTYKDAAGQTTHYSYNAAGQLTETLNALGESSKYNYGPRGRLISVINANNKLAMSLAYDSNGRVATETDSEGYVLRFEYDALDRLIKTIYPDGTSRTLTWKNLDVVAVEDREGNTTHYAYDSNRNLITVTDPLGNETKMTYFRNGELKSLTEPNGGTTTWQIDVQGRPTVKIYADGTKVAMTYENSTSRLHSTTDALRQTKQYGYTVDDRLSGITYLNALNSTPNVEFSYGPYFPRVISMTDGTGTTKYQYVPIGEPGALQLAQEASSFQHETIRYDYDALDRILDRTIDTSTEQWSYDPLGRVVTHTGDLGTFDLSYLGQTKQLTGRYLRGASIGTKISYEPNADDRRPKAIHNTDGTKDFSFTTTPENLITSITESKAGNTPTSLIWNYTYDANDRLRHAASSQGSQYLYELDPDGNITEESGPSYQGTGEYNLLDQVTYAAPLTFKYDKNGNILSDGFRSFRWDAENRLVGVSFDDDSSRISAFQYDGLGRRVLITGATSENLYVWCGDALCATRNTAGTTIRRYYPEGEALTSNQQLLYYSQDQLGSVRGVVGIKGKSEFKTTYDYDPYGYFDGFYTNTTESSLTDFRYAGMFYDQQDGLYLANYRAYEPRKARWLSRDPLEEKGGLNLYGYVGANPLLYADPLGLCANLNKQGCSGSDAQIVRNAVLAALSHLNPAQNETNNIAPLNGNFAKVFNPPAIFTYNWKTAFSSHGSAVESPIIPGQGTFSVKLYDDPSLGNTIAVVYPTNSAMHYLLFIPYNLGFDVNAWNARAYLGCP